MKTPITIFCALVLIWASPSVIAEPYVDALRARVHTPLGLGIAVQSPFIREVIEQWQNKVTK